jgi:disulfide bond formation protein DsbB
MTKTLTSSITSERAALAILAIALAGILSALAFQHLGGYVPCALCYMQRYAYYAGIPLAGLSFLLARSGRLGSAAILLALCGVGFLANAGLGIYHSGVEWKWWPGPEVCGGGDLSAINGNLLDALKNAKPVSCNDAPWRLLGLSFAGWNVVISAGLAVLAVLGLRNSRYA